MPPATCIDAIESDTMVAAGRRLQQASKSQSPSPRRRRLAVSDGGTGRRRLKASGQSEISDEEEEGQTVMTPLHFFGIFIIWITTAFSLLAVRLGYYLHKTYGVGSSTRPFGTPAWFASFSGLGFNQKDIQEEPQWMVDAKSKKVDLHNNFSMLRWSPCGHPLTALPGPPHAP